ncbi:hypothetical protein CJ014_20035 [Pleomorphomonas carboxyditropha]|uniref:Uncharacterized protein n=1 Tax=Pleomorphomonas carboxyditropha TaxID=2023338 RepID=A0A2G9WS60_9HYPH|nr:hypothetical protein CJ014_20035 [Pleomorphomonas carboxyditropha]
MTDREWHTLGTWPAANRDAIEGIVANRIKEFMRIVEIHLQAMDHRIHIAAEILLHKMNCTDIVTIHPIFPSAGDVVARMPELILVVATKPTKPPMHHLGATMRHTR